VSTRIDPRWSWGALDDPALLLTPPDGPSRNPNHTLRAAGRANKEKRLSVSIPGRSVAQGCSGSRLDATSDSTAGDLKVTDASIADFDRDLRFHPGLPPMG